MNPRFSAGTIAGLLAGLSGPVKGILLMIAACTSFAMLDATVKTLAARYPSPMIAWARYFFHVAIMLVILWPRMGPRLLHTQRPGLQLVRGMALGASSLFFYSALGFLPLAETSALAAIAPILVTLAAVRWLGETPPPGAAWALGISFAGVLLIIRPGTALFGWAALLPICTAACGAAYQLATRRLSGLDDGVTTLFLGGLVSLVMMTVVAPFFWAMPGSGLDAVLFVLTGAIGAGGHMLLVKAYEHGSASTLAPFSYAHPVAALPIGLLVFGSFPDQIALTGVSLIVATGAWTAWRQASSAKTGSSKPTPVDTKNESPLSDAAATNAPEIDTPEIDTPAGDAPEVDAPLVDTPAVDTPPTSRSETSR